MVPMMKICNVNAGKLIAGLDFPIYGVSDAEAPANNSIVFVKNTLHDSYKEVKESIFVTKEDMELELDSSCWQAKGINHKNLYGELLKKLKAEFPITITEEVKGSYISKYAKIGNNVKIGPMCIIEEDVVIGDNCTIGAGTVIKAHTRIESNVTIKEYCMIGIEDADIYRDEQGYCKTLPHLAGVIIEEGCLLLAKVVIAAGDTRATVVKRGTLLSVGATLAHNSYIGEGANIGGYADIGGHCNIGAGTYVAPEALVKNRVTVGEDAFVGIGAVVLADVEAGDKVFGNPARKVPVKH